MPDPAGTSEEPRSSGGGLLATAGLLGAQRRWRTPPRLIAADRPAPGAGTVSPASSLLPPPHLEDPEWSRAVLGLLSRVSPATTSPAALILRPDRIDAVFPDSPRPSPEPFSAVGRSRLSLPRESALLALPPGGPPILSATRAAALVTAWNLPEERCLVDVLACKSVAIEGPPVAVGTSLSDVVVELAARRWCDIDEVVVVGLGVPLAGIPALRCLETADEARRYLERAHSGVGEATARCVVVSPPRREESGGDSAARLVELVHALPLTGVLLCGPTETGVRCRLRLHAHKRPESLLLPGSRPLVLRPNDEDAGAIAPRHPPDPDERLLVRILGPVAVEGTPIGQRPRALEILVYLALHAEGVSGEAIAAAVWPERRVPTQTLANRLSEIRQLLGLASDGRPILRRQGPRHVLAETRTDWELFQSLSRSSRREELRTALALVRGRPLAGVADSGWALLEGFVPEMEATIVETAGRLAEEELSSGDATAAEAALRRGLIVAPWDERLYRLLMRAHHVGGNRGGIETALRTLGRALDCPDDPLGCVSRETAELYRQLTRAG